MKKTIITLLLMCVTLFAHAQMDTIRFTQDTTLNSHLNISSNTYITCNPGIWVKVGQRLNNGTIILDGVSNVIFENFNLDINAQENFIVGIYAQFSEDIIIRDSHFINSRDTSALEEWTLMATSFRSTKDVVIEDNVSDGAQFKLAGANGGIEGLLFRRNLIENCTQMGISVVGRANGDTVIIKDVEILNNDFNEIDDYAIYIGVDNGNGDYNYPFYMENIDVIDNTIIGLNWAGSQTAARGIFFRGTKDSDDIRIRRNYIHDTRKSWASYGISVINADASTGDWATNVKIEKNTVLNTDSYSIRIAGADGFTVNENTLGTSTIYGGRGIFVTDRTRNGTINYNELYETRDGIINEGTNVTESGNIFH